MAGSDTKRRRPGARAQAGASARTVRALERRLARLAVERAADQRRHVRQLAAAHRAAERRLAALVREIATLRHHQARVQALERLVAERDAALAAQTDRIAHLEGLLRKAPEMG